MYTVRRHFEDTARKTKHFLNLFTCELAWNTSQTSSRVKTDVGCGRHREMRGECSEGHTGLACTCYRRPSRTVNSLYIIYIFSQPDDVLLIPYMFRSNMIIFSGCFQFSCLYRWWWWWWCLPGRACGAWRLRWFLIGLGLSHGFPAW